MPPPAPKPAPTNPPPMVITSTPAPVVINEVKPPDEVPLRQTSAVPAQPEITAVPLTTTNAIAPPPPESSKTGHKGALAVGAAFLAAAGGLAVFMFRRARKTGGDNPIDSSMKKD
jgi:hypothetical protein